MYYMKKKIESWLIKLAKNDKYWKIVKPFATVGIILTSARISFEESQKKRKEPPNFLANSMFVRNGPFKGMRYPGLDSVGSSIYSKLFGSYESEIQYIIEEIVGNDYSEIIDVGCAEGYYAIGMALRCKTSRIFAYDIDEKARELCSEMADLNKVSDRVSIKSLLTPELLKSFEFSGKGLIICDCEGFEKVLFNQSNLDNVRNCDLLIETHDFIDIEISTYLKKLFGNTHDITSVFSIDDVHKVLNNKYSELEGLSLEEKREIVSERRPAIMEWLFLKSRKPMQSNS